MSRNWLLYLGDLIESGEKIERFVTGRTFDTFVADEAIFDAVLFNLQVIGEATKAPKQPSQHGQSAVNQRPPHRMKSSPQITQMSTDFPKNNLR